jgi:hypothetical protein
MAVLQNGQFSITIGSEELARGLRPSKRVPRDSKYLNECEGAVGLDGVLQVLSDLSLSAVDVSALVNVVFPFPQLFVLERLTIICTLTKIYELVSGSLVEKLTVPSGITWSVVDFKDYIYMSNGKVAVVREATSQIWTINYTLPTACSMVNFNGQIMVGAPDVEMV